MKYIFKKRPRGVFQNGRLSIPNLFKTWPERHLQQLNRTAQVVNVLIKDADKFIPTPGLWNSCLRPELEMAAINIQTPMFDDEKSTAKKDKKVKGDTKNV